jgi:Tol biopolymer transport system component
MSVDRFERTLPDLLTEISLPSVPDYTDDLLGLTARSRQRPGWTFPERWLPMDIAVQRPAGVSPMPWRTIGVVALLIALVAVAVVVVGSRQPRLPAPFGPAANGSLIYDKGGDIYIADADATNERLLIGGDTNDYAATWSRDGTKVFFGRNVAAGVLVMTADADGRNVRELSAPLVDPGSVDLSPTSAQLAVEQTVDGRRTISILSLSGDRAVRNLDLGDLIPAGYVGWRPPVGNDLVFVATEAGAGPDLGLYAIGSDGNGLRQLTIQLGESEPGQENPTQYSFQDVKLSPDGSTAAYWNWEMTVDVRHTCYIHLLDLTTGQDRRMSYDPSATCELMPIFTPDGESVVAERQTEEGIAQLFWASADGSAPPTRLGTTYPYTSREGFTLSPDGTMVVYVPTYTTSSVRLISIADGSEQDKDVKFISIPSWQRLAQ